MPTLDMTPTPPITGYSSHLSRKALGWALGVLAATSWAAYLVLARAGTSAGLEASDFALLRYGGATLVLAPFALRHDRATFGHLGWGRAATLALCSGPLFIAASTGGYRFAPLVHGAVAQPAAATLGALLLAAAVLHERLSPVRLLGVLVLLGGIALVLLAGDAGFGTADRTWPGDLLFVVAGFVWAMYSVLLRRWRVDPLHAAVAVSTLSAVAVMPLYLVTGDIGRLAGLPRGALVLQILVQGGLAGGIAVVAYGRAVAMLGAAGAAPFQAVVPGLAILLGIPALGELPSAPQMLGLGIASLGAVVAIGLVPVRMRSPVLSAASKQVRR